MSSSVYCFLSYGDLKFLPFESHISITDVEEIQKENDRLPYLPSTLQISGLSSPSMSSLASSTRNFPSPTPDIIDLNTENLVSSSHSAHSVYLRDDYVNISTEDSDTNSVLKDQLFKLLNIIFPSWSSEDVKVKQLTGGITNMLLSVTNAELSRTVLVRTYGQGTSVIIDRDREFVTQLSLHSLGLAAPIYARFGNGLVYGFISGRALTPDELSHPSLYPLIAQLLGHWHTVMKGDDIYEGILKLKQLRGEESKVGEDKVLNNIWELILNWIQVLPEIDSLLNKCLSNRHLLESKDCKSLKEIFSKELEWIIKNISHKSPTVLCHCDLLSGNVIIPDELSTLLENGTPIVSHCSMSENPVSFIDYEYAFPLPRAFDISNHFMEWQGFECDKSKIPLPTKDNIIMRNWSKLYLSSNDGHEISEEDVDGLIEEIGIFYGLPGFYWGIWAGIQSTISIIDFDYKNYCCERLNEYFIWKERYTKISQESTTIN